MGVLTEDFQIAFVNNVSVSDVLEIGTLIAYLVCNTISGFSTELTKDKISIENRKEKKVFYRIMYFL